MKNGLYFPVVGILLFLSIAAGAQSTSQDFPTPVLTNDITGNVKARDLGDSRLTTYFYTFDGDQGDLFINVVTRNFTGDIDLFTMSGLRPVTKIVVFANDADNETGRAVYFRKTETLLLRIQGRSPNDEDASFKIKFAGSFVAARSSDTMRAPELPKVDTNTVSGNRVNSVGTILPMRPKPDAQASDEIPAKKEVEGEIEAGTPPARPKREPEKAAKGLEIVVTDTTPKAPDKAESVRRTKPSAPPRRRAVKKPEIPSPPPVETEAEKTAKSPSSKEIPEVKENKTSAVKRTPSKRNVKAIVPPPVREAAVDPLASIRLVIALKNGDKLEKPMSEVFKFSVDKGVLTVILKDGSISRYQIVDVAKVTIE